jgi:hypothetical protein
VRGQSTGNRGEQPEGAAGCALRLAHFVSGSNAARMRVRPASVRVRKCASACVRELEDPFLAVPALQPRTAVLDARRSPANPAQAATSAVVAPHFRGHRPFL